jgi:Bacterial Ig domain
VTIKSSLVNGTLNLWNGQTTLNDVTGGDIFANNTNVVLQHSSVSSLHLGAGATASIDPSSSYKSISPALPVLTISSPVANMSYTGKINAQVGVNGIGITVLTFTLDGKQLPSLLGGAPPGPQVSYPIDTTPLPDGTHTLTVLAVQFDLLSSSASISFVTHNQLLAVTNDLATANKSLSTANSNISSLQGNLNSANHSITYLTDLVFLAIAVAVLAIALGAYAIRGGKAPWKY